MMEGSLAPRPSRLDRAAETAAALLFLLAYIVWVSRGDLLPYAGPARSLTAPLLAAALAVLVGWRLRARLIAAWHAGQIRRWVLVAGGLGLAVTLRLVVGGFGRPIEAAEEAVLVDAIRLMRNRPPTTTDPVTLALAWLHLPTAGFAHLAAVSAGWWVELRHATPAAILPFGRGLHLAGSLVMMPLVSLAATRLGSPAAGWLAALLLALSGPAILSAATIDPGAPLGLVLALALVATTGIVKRQNHRPPGRLVLIGLAALGLVGLWLPTPLGAVFAPLAATVAGPALVALRGTERGFRIQDSGFRRQEERRR